MCLKKFNVRRKSCMPGTKWKNDLADSIMESGRSAQRSLNPLL